MTRHCIVLSILFCCLLISPAAKAQGLKPVWKQEVSGGLHKQGDTIELVFSASIPAGIFVYGPGTECEIGPIKPSLTLKLEGATAVGQVYSTTEKKVQDDIFNCLTGKWDKHAELRQRIVITGGAALSYSGSLETQYCDDKKGMCFMQHYDF